MLTLCLGNVASLQAETLRLTSLEWPPYSGANLPDQGASIAVVRAALAAVGHELEVVFYPWARATRLAESDARYQGYFPEYFFTTDSFVFSDPIGVGPLGLIERIENPIAWTTLDDLAAFRLGVVQDYVNTAELDANIARGVIEVEAVPSDRHNLQMVSFGRVDAAVMDPNVFRYLTSHDPELIPLRDELQVNERRLEDKGLYVAFNNSPDGRLWAKRLNEGLMLISVTEIMARYGLQTRP